MRAKTINEMNNFERGLDPKQSMKLGSSRGGKILFDIIFEESKKIKNLFLITKTSLADGWSWKDLENFDNSEASEYFKLIFNEMIFLYHHREVSIILMKSGNVYLYDNSNFNEKFKKYRLLENLSEFWKYIKKPPKKNKMHETINFERGQEPKDSMDIGISKKLNAIKGINAFTHWLYYADAPGFIKQIWGDTSLGNHFKEKFNGILSRSNESYMSPNSLMKFVRELGKENQELLFTYIIENHSDKW